MEQKIKVVFLTGAGLSANAGIPTYRDSDGLWQNHDFTKLASIQGYRANPELCIKFYNERRRSMEHINPTNAHKLINLLENDDRFEVSIITQNIDNLHEKAGSINVTHFHGEIFKMCNDSKTEVLEYNKDIIFDEDFASDGTQLRPYVTMFGEQILVDIDKCVNTILEADYVVVIGTSLEVYPFADLIDLIPLDSLLVVINKDKRTESNRPNTLNYITDADTGVLKFIKHLQDVYDYNILFNSDYEMPKEFSDVLDITLKNSLKDIPTRNNRK